MLKFQSNLEISIGDTIKFTVNTRAGKKTATRVVGGFWDDENTIPTVTFEGWNNFAVNQKEIIEHIKK